MPPALAARRTDATTHGGTIVDGAATVRIGGEPAARLDDPHTCPLSTEAGIPHVGGVITAGSRTVRIGRKAAARMGDSCDCATVGVAGRNTPRTVISDDFDRDNDGRIDGHQDLNSVTERHDSIEGTVLGVPLFASSEAQGIYVDSERHAHGDSTGVPGGSVALGGEAALEHGRVAGGIGPANRPVVALSGEMRAGRVQGQGSLQGGDSGRETGVGYGVHLGADAINLQGGVLIDLRAVRLEGSIDNGIGIGLENEQGWHYDRIDGELHVRTGLAIHPLPGFNIELSIPNPWRDADASPNAGIPNTIAEGCPTVRIG